MLSNIGVPGLLLIFGIFVLLFGAKKIPEISESLGKGIKKFKETQSDIESPKITDKTEDDPKA